MKLGAGDDLYALFAGILTMRPWNRVVDSAIDHLVIQGSEGERSELQVSFHEKFSSLQIYKCTKYAVIKCFYRQLISNFSIFYELRPFVFSSQKVNSYARWSVNMGFMNFVDTNLLISFIFFIKQMYASQYFSQISELLRRLPRVILLMLKTNDCLRAVNNSLVFSLTFVFAFASFSDNS